MPSGKNKEPSSGGFARSGELGRKVREWIAQSGFELELYVARQLVSHGFRVSQSRSYVGEDPDETIEVDTEGRLTLFELDSDAQTRVVNIVTITECKKAHLPWVLFSARARKRDLSLPLRRHTDGLGDRMVAGLSLQNSDRGDLDLEVPDRLGFSLRTALLRDTGAEEGNSIRLPRQLKASAELAVSQLRAAASAWTGTYKLGEEDDPGYAGWILFPVIVVDGSLFECYQSDDGGPVVEEIDRGLLSLSAPRTDLAGLPVDVVTRDAFPGLLDSFRDFSERVHPELATFVTEENERIASAWADSARRGGGG